MMPGMETSSEASQNPLRYPGDINTDWLTIQ